MSKNNVFIPVFSFNQGIGEAFWRDLVLAPGSQSELPVEDQTAHLELIRGQDIPAESLQPVIERADAAVLLVKYLDTQSLERIKRLYQAVSRRESVPISIIIMRDAKEAQFRISCTHCDQNLWVRDRSVGLKGKCKACGKMFFIPAQKAYVTSSLMLTDIHQLQELTLGEKRSGALLEAIARKTMGLEPRKVSASDYHPRTGRVVHALRNRFTRRIAESLSWRKA